jgi:hypothetical protein
MAGRPGVSQLDAVARPHGLGSVSRAFSVRSRFGQLYLCLASALAFNPGALSRKRSSRRYDGLLWISRRALLWLYGRINPPDRNSPNRKDDPRFPIEEPAYRERRAFPSRRWLYCGTDEIAPTLGASRERSDPNSSRDGWSSANQVRILRPLDPQTARPRFRARWAWPISNGHALTRPPRAPIPRLRSLLLAS